MYLSDWKRGHKSGSCSNLDTRFVFVTLQVQREIIISDYLTPLSKICLIVGLSLTSCNGTSLAVSHWK